MSALPPNPCLVAIILLIKTKHGVKHIYHYPPHPGRDHQAKFPRTDKDDGGDSSGSDSGEGVDSSSSTDSLSSVEDSFNSSSNDDNPSKSGHAKTRSDASRKAAISKDIGDINESGSTSPEKPAINGWKATKGNKELLGLPPGFPAFLCPPTELDRRRFEMGIDHLTFLGWPCFAKEDGHWKTKRRDRRMSSKDKIDVKSASAMASEPRMKIIEEAMGQDHSVNHASLINSSDLSEIEPGESTVEESGEDFTEPMADAAVRATEQAKFRSASESTHSGTAPQATDALSMFHVVFVMNPPPLEYQVRVDDMYSHVVKNFSKALKREQARSNYVWKECVMLKAMKARHDPASREVLKSSRLAKAISTLYKSISSSRIAQIELTPKRTIWVHIPSPASISSLPDPTEPQLPGVWLTTATAIPNNDEFSSTSNKLTSHFALLLLSDVQSILASVSPRSRIRPALEQYLGHTSPNKSFLQISQKSKIVLDDITIMASHLTHWGQARIIPPLNKKDTYILSPNADMRRLKSAAIQFQREFPLQPSLTSILARLNSANRPYKTLIPNKDHKDAYMDVLAWLMRYGWVTQIRTFAWVRVSGHIRMTVDKAQKQSADEPEQQIHQVKYKRHHDDRYSSAGEDATSATDEEDHTDDENHLTFPTNGRPRSTLSTQSIRSRGSVSSALTAVPIREQSNEAWPSDHDSLPAMLISNPTELSGEQRRYLEYISSAVERKGGAEAKDAWTRCLAFFDGQHSIEQIPVREGWKRSWLDGLRAGWVKEGWLIEGRSW